MTALRIRSATLADAVALDRLAQLDDRPLPAGPHLLAEADGVLVAALGRDGAAVADPFAYTADTVALLRERARLLAGRPRSRRTARRRLATA